jgi:signal transduction histidine kinase
MVDEFSRFARMPRPHPTRTDLDQLVEETAGLYKEIKSGVQVDWEVEDRARFAWVDREQIKSVLINLLDNALEATEAPGSVSVRVDTRGGFVEMRVADTGAGITPEDKERLFQPHFSTKGRGTGLGLTIAHRVVTEHHGTIRAESNQPQGTVFIVELPLSRQDQQDQDQQVEDDEA